MAQPIESLMPGYVIYRDTQPGKPVDPTTPPVFFPPKDSDELFDALRARFPLVKTHSERMRDAIIEFLIEERQSEQIQSSSAAPSTSNTANTSPWLQSWPSVSVSTLSSPEMTTIMTPRYDNSPQAPPQSSGMGRQLSTTTSADQSEASTPALEQMTSVFSLSSSEQPKQRIRRRMTEAEKVEYRKRRIVKACDKCSKRKRKCHHNQPEMDHVTAKSHKVSKQATMSKRAVVEETKPHVKPDPLIHIRDDMDLSDTWFNEMQPVQDFSTLLEDPGMSFADNSFLDPTFADPAWQWPMGDFTLIDDFNATFDHGVLSGSDSSSQESPSFDTSQADSPMPEISPQTTSSSGQHQHGGWASIGDFSASNGNRVLWEHLRTGQDEPAGDSIVWEDILAGDEDNQPQHTPHTHKQSSCDAYDQGGVRQGTPGKSALGESAPRKNALGESAPGNSAYANNALGENAPGKSALGKSANGKSVPGNSASAAVPHGSSIHEGKPVAGILEQSLSGQETHDGLPGEGIQQPSGRSFTTSRASQSASLRKNGHGGLEDNLPFGTNSTPSTSEPAGAGPFEVMQIGDYLRMKTNISNIEKGPSVGHRLELETDVPPQPQRSPHRGQPSGLALNPAPGSSGGMLQHSPAAQGGRQGLSLGGTSLDAVASPRTDFFLLRCQLFIRQSSTSARAQTDPTLAVRATLSPQAGSVVSTTIHQENAPLLQSRSSLQLRPSSTSSCHLEHQEQDAILAVNPPSVQRAQPGDSSLSTPGGFAQALFAKKGIFTALFACLALFAVSAAFAGAGATVAPSALLLALLCPTCSKSDGGMTGSSRLSQARSLLTGQSKRTHRMPRMAMLLA